MSHKMTQTEWEQEMSCKILDLIRSQLYLDFRYLDSALSSLTFAPDESLSSMATDGICLYFSSEQILRLYPVNPLYLNRSYLHSVLHCIFRHLWIRNNREPVLWNLACDIVVERILDRLERPSVKRILSLTRIQYYEHLDRKQLPLSAAVIYRDLLSITDAQLQMKLQLEFITDDHRYWPADPVQSPRQQAAGEAWEKKGRRISQDLLQNGSEAGTAASEILSQISRGKPRRSYHDFLKKFTVIKEELSCDYDEFDLNYYTYGLRIYGNMPLIEPSESREILRISDFVIVIDTSYSTNGDLVRRFLYETFRIIGQRDSFFHKSQIRIIQSDDRIQRDEIIQDERDLSRLLASFTLKGGGGTDFRPAFSYVNSLLEEGAFHDLKGLIYFTDGKGIYPKKAPAYDTAFVFIQDQLPDNVPAWAMKIRLEEEDLPAEWKQTNAGYLSTSTS